MAMLDKSETFEVWHRNVEGQPFSEGLVRSFPGKGDAFGMRDQFEREHAELKASQGAKPTKQYVVIRCVTKRHLTMRSISERRTQ
jgi:hypothetical protein